MSDADLKTPKGNDYTITLTFSVQVRSNVRDDYLRVHLGNEVSQELQAWCQKWTEAGGEGSDLYCRFVTLVGPSSRVHWDQEELRKRIARRAGEGYEPDEPYDPQAQAQYERDLEGYYEGSYSPEADPYQGETAQRYEEGKMP